MSSPIITSVVPVKEKLLEIEPLAAGVSRLDAGVTGKNSDPLMIELMVCV